jgi:hypothetical protein
VTVAIYTRISTDDEHQPYSLEARDTRLGAYIASQDGWELNQAPQRPWDRKRSRAARVEARPRRCSREKSIAAGATIILAYRNGPGVRYRLW